MTCNHSLQDPSGDDEVQNLSSEVIGRIEGCSGQVYQLGCHHRGSYVLMQV